MNPTKYIFVTGGVVSSLGKGIVASSLAKLLQARGFSVAIQKLDPYINVDPDTLNPYEHGECFVTIDGAVTDLDLGHYERFLSINTTQANNITTGRIYQTVIQNERKGEYNGKTVQVIPHITNEIKRNIRLLGADHEIVITEIGGTAGDIESLPYIETVRQLRYELGAGNSLVIHLTLVPYLSAAQELKSKPTQHSVKQLLENGIQPDILVLRTEHELSEDFRKKTALFCNVDPNAVIQSIDVPSIYEVPIKMQEEKLDEVVLHKLQLSNAKPADLTQWKSFLEKYKSPKQTVNIGLVGKYVELHDAYKSILEAFVQAGAYNECKVQVHYFQAEDVTANNVAEMLKDMQAVLVAPGFGSRGIEGKIAAIRYVRENKIPFLGICLGMQCAVIEFARNVLGFADANSAEIDSSSSHKVVDIMEDQKNLINRGGTMRLGSYPCNIKKGTLAYKTYGNEKIKERHRHRYEFNDKYLADFERAGMIASGMNRDAQLVEIMEVPSHPFFIGTQFHPEYQSTVLHPHPLFLALVKAAMKK
ncbi:CTP synthase [Bacteroidia bacterium]|nr:CTP synthase [Bacteroidia bacterium]GHT81158.1 CTP synthase [Bacteroidia bacterium]